MTRLDVNRIDAPGTREQAWDSWRELRLLPAADPSSWPSVAVVAAHPDDEVLGVGGTMAILAAAGARLRLIAVTDGEASHPDSDPAAIALTRTAESAAALSLLGAQAAEVVRLRLPDTAVAAHEDELSGLLRELCAGFDVCLAPWDAGCARRSRGRGPRGPPGGLGGRPDGARATRSGCGTGPGRLTRACPGRARAGYRCPPASRPGSVRPSRPSPASCPAAGLRPGPVLPPGIVAHFTREQEVLLR